jgi:hypothetical protein
MFWHPSRTQSDQGWAISSNVGDRLLLTGACGSGKSSRAGRLFLAGALLQGSDVVILDESFAALDPETLEQAPKCAMRRARHAGRAEPVLCGVDLRIRAGWVIAALERLYGPDNYEIAVNLNNLAAVRDAKQVIISIVAPFPRWTSPVLTCCERALTTFGG